MKQLKKSTQFKKDLKRYLNKPSKLKALKEVTTSLQMTGKVPAEYKPHPLTGKFKGFLECHVEDDFLLIWISETADAIKLVRLGTHHELFGK